MTIPYIIVNGKLLENRQYSMAEKNFLSVLAVLTKKGKIDSMCSNTWIANYLGISKAYLSVMIKKFVKEEIITIGKSHGVRTIGFTMYVDKKETWDQIFYNFKKEK